MNTIKKFIHYYGPYKTVFFIDLICAAVISLIDLAYPQILRTMTKTLFTQDQSRILHALPVIAGGLFLMYVIQCLCKYYVTCQGHMMGANMERDMRQELFDHYQQLSVSPFSSRIFLMMIPAPRLLLRSSGIRYLMTFSLLLIPTRSRSLSLLSGSSK